ncbi:hypothetical protein, partial [Burkholderia vietnamiensis]|uniref:hypothetical protein n=1 Tax=Burkholderia vietnamiensis TaxID=60552 RepID=UPI000AA22153
MTTYTNQPTEANLHAAKVLGHIEDARRAKNPADGILQAAELAEARPGYETVAETLRFVAKRLKVDPWDATGCTALGVQIEPHRVLWRLQLLREWSHEQEAKQVF